MEQGNITPIEHSLPPSAGERKMSFFKFKDEILADYRLACESREASLLGRKEVLTGKAKFGIFGDGKELAQIALAKFFQDGDYRSGYYRDQTWMFAMGQSNIQQFFAQLYADTNLENEPASGGRQMNSHFATRMLDEQGNWKYQTKMKNSAADSSPTASQMVRALGLAHASKIYRNNPKLSQGTKFSNNGNEVVFASIGDASTSEGVFWETVNAAGVMKVPLAINIWDDGYGISVPRKFQTTKGNISEVLKGFKTDNISGDGIDIYRIKGWDYPSLCKVYSNAIKKIRKTHRPAIFHITEVTQPQGHSTSGSHERYKSSERLQWEKDFDCLVKMREWMIESGLADAETLDKIAKEAKATAKAGKQAAWQAFNEPIQADIKSLESVLDQFSAVGANEAAEGKRALKSAFDPIRKDTLKIAKMVLRKLRNESDPAIDALKAWTHEMQAKCSGIYNTHLHSEGPKAALKVEPEAPVFSESSPLKNGYEILNSAFDQIFSNNKMVVAFGEDVGKIGDVNQGFAGIQDKHGEHRIWDTGIREATIMGDAIGLSMRGIRPIAEIQYLDYLLYGLQPLSDDLATLQYRTRGGQKAPAIIRTRGHRLEGIWHTGSPMGMIINALRGLHVCVPRNMVQAVGFYNTMLASDDPALIVECLNGYRLKERVPDNLTSFKIPLGVPEVLHEGDDVTLVSYGSTLRVAESAMEQLSEVGITVELIDVQTLLPFDIDHKIIESIKKTGRVVFLDEDVPGGATAYMMQKVMQEQNAFYYLDSEPITITAKPHRSPYASDGDYFSKPNAEEIFETIYKLMHEVDPGEFPMYF